jgi:hypothetical protein
MWRSSSSCADGGGYTSSPYGYQDAPRGMVGTGGTFFVPVHAEHVNKFIAGEFSQWLGDRYGYSDAAGEVHTAGLYGTLRRGVKKASNFVQGKNPAIADMEAKLKKLEEDLVKHRQTTKGSTGLKQKYDAQQESALVQKIKDTDIMIKQMELAQHKTDVMARSALAHKARQDGRVHHYPQKPVQRPEQNNMHSTQHNSVDSQKNHWNSHTEPIDYSGGHQTDDDENPNENEDQDWEPLQIQNGGNGDDYDPTEIPLERSSDRRGLQSLPARLSNNPIPRGELRRNYPM